MKTSELEQFWNQKEYKIYVVRLTHPTNKVPGETRYVRVKSETDTAQARLRAARVAVANSIDFSAGKPLDWSARLAHPVGDLGCVESKATDLRVAA